MPLPGLLLSLCALALAPAAHAQNLSSSQVDTIRTHLAASAQQSWELGTRAQAILELDTPAWSVLTPGVTFPRSTDEFAHPPDSLSEVLEIARTVVGRRSQENNGVVGPQPLLANSAAGDPPSIGFAVVLANLTGHTPGADNVSYATAAKDQLDYVLNNVPRTSDGAISHRDEQVQLWSDFVYMVPPFLAFYGVATGNESLLTEAVKQCRLYRQYLKDNGSDTDGLWRHILLGRGTDTGFWSTGELHSLCALLRRAITSFSGNAWAAAGMTRVLATIAASPHSSSFKSEQQDLVQWTNEIQSAIVNWVVSGLFYAVLADDAGLRIRGGKRTSWSLARVHIGARAESGLRFALIAVIDGDHSSVHAIKLPSF